MDRRDDTFLSKEVAGVHFVTIAEALERIEEQTTTTNGKVAAISKKQEFMNGFLHGVAVFIAGVVLPLLGWALYQISVNSKTIAQLVVTVDAALHAK